MLKIKNVFAVILMICAVLGLTGCGSDGGSSSKVEITYMVEDSEYMTVSFNNVSDVNHPDNPTKDGWTFVGWYTDSEFTTGSLFVKDSYTGNSTFKLYARFSQNTVSAYVDGELFGDVILNEAEESKPTSDDLSFDGWYIDALFTTKYVNQDVDNLYGRFRALVTITNGYEVVYTEFVNPGDTFSEPEYSSVRKSYMAEDGYYHFTTGEIGTEDSLVKFDFSNEIEINTTINLMWESVGLTYTKSDFDTLNVARSSAITGDTNASDVLSVPSYAYFEGVLYPVETVNNFYYSTAKKLIVNYNIKGISNTTSAVQTSSSNLNEVILPDSLKVIFSSFTDTTSFTSETFTLNEGIEVIIDSFRLGYSSSVGYDFDIYVPNSIKYMSIVTTNYIFDDNCSYYTEDINGEKAIFTDVSGKKTLVSYVPTDLRDIVVPEGIYGINASAFVLMSQTLDTLSLPSTFDSVNNYPAHADYSYMNSYLFTSAKSYSILQNLSVYSDTKEISSVIINQQSLSSNLDNCLIGQVTYSEYINYKNSYFDGSYKVLFIGEVETGETVFVNVYITNTTTGVSGVYALEMTSGSVIDLEFILCEITINSVSLFDLIDSGDYLLNGVSQFGEDYFMSKEMTVTKNLYLTLNYAVSPAGAELTLSDDGTYYIVTGFDESTAKLQDDDTYLVNIPGEFNGLAVTEIAASAMANQSRIGKVVIPSSVKIIGEKAFYYCNNLTELEIAGENGLAEILNGVEIYATIGKIEYIYESAFEGTSIVSPIMGLESMIYVAPYAFKTSTITHFTNISSTTTYKGGIKNGSGSSAKVREDLVIGKYYYSFESKVAFIYCYQGQELVSYEFTAGTETERLTLDLQIVAVAGGYKTKAGMYHYLALGYSGKSVSFGDMGFIISVEILEGSMYYLSDLAVSNGLVLLNVSKVHKNAFTDMAAKYSENSILTIFPGREGNDEVNYISLDEASAVATADYYTTYVDDNGDFNGIFEEGWWQGIMADDADYESKMGFMGSLHQQNMIWYM